MPPPSLDLSAYPIPSSPSLPDSIPTFFSTFYASSDTPPQSFSAESYANAFFTSDATFTLASKSGTGTEEIVAMRKGMWEYVESRKHAVLGMYPRGGQSEVGKVMLHGMVEFRLKKNGKMVKVEWAGRAELVKDENGAEGEMGLWWKMRLYQVYMDTAVAAAAMKDD